MTESIEQLAERVAEALGWTVEAVPIAKGMITTVRRFRGTDGEVQNAPDNWLTLGPLMVEYDVWATCNGYSIEFKGANYNFIECDYANPELGQTKEQATKRVILLGILARIEERKGK